MSISTARRTAFEILRLVELGGYATELLQARLNERVSARDAALATELVLGVLRWQRLLDYLIEQQTRKPPAKLDAEVRAALRLGLYQLRFLARVPPRAAIHESVELVKQERKRSAAPLVNAVLRRAPRGPVESLLPNHLVVAERLGILYSHPTWLVKRWLARYGETRTVLLLEANNRPPRAAAIVLAQEDEEVHRVEAELRGEGIRTEPGKWLRKAVQVKGGRLSKTRAFLRGEVAMQDEASQMVAQLVDVQPGQTVLDLCAAPGGKTIALARQAEGEGRVLAADIHPGRLRAARERLERAGIRGIAMVAFDGTAPIPLAAQFDRILVDAPCSGTGTLARNPEIRWRLSPQDLQVLQQRQLLLLENSCAALRAGGRLVYATCSLETEENEDVVARFLDAHPELSLMDAAPLITPHLRMGVAAESLVGTDRFLRTFPPEHLTDGFFSAVMEKR